MPDDTTDGWVLYFDGLTEPKNPGGVSAWGYTLHRPGEPPITGKGSIEARPENTNNRAEYVALGIGLHKVLDLIKGGAKCRNLFIFGDSKLVVCQLNGTWKCNLPHLQKLRDRCLELLKAAGVKWEADWIPREQNVEADELSKDAYRELTGHEPPERGRAIRS